MADGGSSGAENVAREAVRFLVNRACSRVPVRKADLVKFISTLQPDLTAPEKKTVMEITAEMLEEIYGYKLKLISIKGVNQYILVLKRPSGDLHAVVENPSHTLLVAALAHIFMSGGSVKDDDLWKFMERAGLMKIDDHAIRKIFTQQFTKELYLNYIKVGESDHARYTFEWGDRATAEFPKVELLKKIGEAFDRSTEHWCEQSKAGLESDENNFS